jgi:hypothetical protein
MGSVFKFIAFAIGFVMLLGILSVFLGPADDAGPPSAEVVREPAEAAAPVSDSVGGCALYPASAGASPAELRSDSVQIRTGPGPEFPEHESGFLYRFEPLQVLQRCNGWAQGRVLSNDEARTVVAERGEKGAIAAITFWLPLAEIHP